MGMRLAAPKRFAIGRGFRLRSAVNLIWVVVVLAVTGFAATPGQTAPIVAPHYDITLRLDPAQSRWSATVQATGIACTDGVARLHLHRDIQIVSATVDGVQVSPVLDPPGAPRFWIDAARSFDVPCPRRSLVLDYEGPGQLHPDGRNQVSPRLVELSLYGAWYPLVTIDDKIAWRLTTQLPRGWTFATPATARVRSGVLSVRSQTPADIVLIASPLFREEQIRAGETTVRLLVNGELAADQRANARAMATAAADMADWATATLGSPTAEDKLTPQIIFSPRGGALSYSRLPLILLREEDLRTTSGRPALLNVRHEIAHFWSRAPQGVDWLNEGVAEYLALRRTGDTDGAAARDAILADYRRQIAAAGNSPPITAGPDDRTFLNTYARPALLFDALARRHGADAVDRLLKALFDLGAAQSVDTLLAAIGDRFGAVERERVAACLVASDWSVPCGG